MEYTGKAMDLQNYAFVNPFIPRSIMYCIRPKLESLRRLFRRGQYCYGDKDGDCFYCSNTRYGRICNYTGAYNPLKRCERYASSGYGQEPKAKVLRKRTIYPREHRLLYSVLSFVIGSLVLTLMLYGGIGVLGLILHPESMLSPPGPRLIESQVFDLINKERSDRGLPILRNNSRLVVVAQGWSESMLSRGVLEHGDFEGRMQRLGYLGKYMCGEVAGTVQSYGSDIADQLVQAWLKSSGHREIILTPKAGEMGVGIACDGHTYYATVDFIFYD